MGSQLEQKTESGARWPTAARRLEPLSSPRGNRKGNSKTRCLRDQIKPREIYTTSVPAGGEITGLQRGSLAFPGTHTQTIINSALRGTWCSDLAEIVWL